MKKKYLLVVISILVILLTIIGITGYFAFRKISLLSIAELEQLVSEQIGYNVAIANIKPKWAGVNLVMRVEYITLQDKNTALPVFQANYIESKLNFWKTISNFELRFSRITVNKPQISINYEHCDVFDPNNITQYLSVDKLFKGILSLKSSRSFLREMQEFSIVDGVLNLQCANGISLPISQIEMQATKSQNKAYKVHGIGVIADNVPSSFVIDGEFFGQPGKFDKTKGKLKFSGKNFSVASFANIASINSVIKQGVIEAIDLVLVWQHGKVKTLQGDVKVADIVTSTPNEFVKAQGKIDYTDAETAVNFTITELAYRNQNIFTKEIVVPLVSGKLTWQNINNKLLLEAKNTEVNLPDLKIKADIGTSYQNGKLSDTTLHVITEEIAVDAAHKYLPQKILPHELAEWLQSAVHGGMILSNSLVYSSGKFDLIMNFKDVNLEYAPQWPALMGLSGNLHLNERQVNILGISGKILDSQIGMTTASVDGLNRKESFPLIIEGDINTTLSQGLQFLLASPLKQTGNILAAYKPQGNMGLSLKLQLPLVEVPKTNKSINFTGIPKVTGKLKISEATLADPQLMTTLTAVNGVVNFSENTINAQDLTLNFLGQPAIANVDYDASKAKLLEVALKTQLADQALINVWPILSKLKFTGKTPIDVKFYVPMEENLQKQIIASSDLLGVTIDLPYPFGKTTEQKIPFILTLVDNNKLKLDVLAEDPISGTFVLDNKFIKQGQLMLGQPIKSAVAKNNVLYVRGKIKQCDLRDWLPLISKDSKAVNMPVDLELLIEQLNFGTKFNKIKLHYDTNSGAFVLNGAGIIGNITLATDKKPALAKFKQLAVESSQHVVAKTKTLAADDLSKIVFNCDDFILNSTPIGAVNFTLQPKLSGYDIRNLEVDSDNFNLQGKGWWHLLDKEATNLSGNIASNDFGKMFNSWGFGQSINSGIGDMSFKFDWNGSPLDFKLAHVTGAVDLYITAGQIRGVNPGFGRIIGLLSVDNIQRRLKLDFSDLLGNGFAFDKLQAKFDIHNGTLHTEGVFIDGPSAYIVLSGDAYIKTKQINFKMGIVPKLGASLPLAAAITAGNPALGAAFWIFNKATGKKSSSLEIPKYRYHVTGTWEKPEIQEIR